MPHTYTNPRMRAVIENWPIGSKRTQATFEVQSDPRRGERGTRFTLDPRTGRSNATKALTYAKKVRIVDGDDGKTYFLELTGYGFISVMRGDAKLQEETIWPKDERYESLISMFRGV